MRSANYIAILFCFVHVTFIVQTTKWALVRDCNVFGNNLEAILEVLVEEDEFERELTDTVNQASLSDTANEFLR